MSFTAYHRSYKARGKDMKVFLDKGQKIFRRSQINSQRLIDLERKYNQGSRGCKLPGHMFAKDINSAPTSTCKQSAHYFLAFSVMSESVV